MSPACPGRERCASASGLRCSLVSGNDRSVCRLETNPVQVCVTERVNSGGRGCGGRCRLHCQRLWDSTPLGALGRGQNVRDKGRPAGAGPRGRGGGVGAAKAERKGGGERVDVKEKNVTALAHYIPRPSNVVLLVPLCAGCNGAASERNKE